MRSGLNSWCKGCQLQRTREWRSRNRDYELSYNTERRAHYRAEHPLPEKRCVVCGDPFVRRPDALVCGERCRNRRKRAQRKARAA